MHAIQSEPVQDTHALKLTLHGYPALRAGQRVIPLKLKRGFALLAYLSGQRGKVGREHLATLLWPDASPAVARGRLRRLVHQTHEVIGRTLFEADSDSLWLARGLTSDLQATSAAIAAVHAMPGIDAQRLAPLVSPEAARFLDGFTLDADTFGDWLLQARRAHLAALTLALERAAARAVAQQDGDLAESAAAALLRLDGCNEAACIAMIESRAMQGDAAGAENAYHQAAERLREELGVRPSAAIEQAYARALAQLRSQEAAIRFAPTSAGQVAYASWGRGAQTIVVLWGLMSNVEVALEEPRAKALLDQLARHHRVVMLDRRGSGLAERVGVQPDAATVIEDIEAVLDHLGVHQAWLFGSAAGGTLALEAALRRRERIAGLLLYGTSPVGHWDADAPWGLRDEQFEPWIRSLTDPDHYQRSLRTFAPSAAEDPAVQRWYARLLRNASSPQGVVALLRAYHALDLRPHLRRIAVPTLVLQRRGDRLVPAAAGRSLAAAIPGAQLRLLDGEDHFLWHGDRQAIVDAVLGFVGQADQRVLRAA